MTTKSIGYVYRIFNEDDSYYGSTSINSSERWKRHQKDYYKYKKKREHNYVSSFVILNSRKRYEIEMVEKIIEDGLEKLRHKMKEKEEGGKEDPQNDLRILSNSPHNYVKFISKSILNDTKIVLETIFN